MTGGAEGGPAGNADQLLDQVVEGLRVGTWEEFGALDGEIQSRPPTALEPPCPGGSFLPPPVGELGTGGFGSGIVGGVAPPGTVQVAVTAAGGHRAVHRDRLRRGRRRPRQPVPLTRPRVGRVSGGCS